MQWHSWFHSHPTFVLPSLPQCESRRSAMGRYRLPSLSEDEEGEGEQEEEEDEEFSLTRASTNFLKQVLAMQVHQYSYFICKLGMRIAQIASRRGMT